MNKQVQTGILPSPIRFSLTDLSQQPAIYIGQANPLTFTIGNSGDRKIDFTALTKDPDASNYHFELRFRPGTLLLPDPEKLKAHTNTVKPIVLNENKQTENWKISTPVVNGNDTVSIYFGCSKAFSLEHEAGILNDLILTLENVQALPGAEGARGTRVELRYDNMKISGSHALKGDLLQYVNIVNHSGAQIIPLRAEIIGSNTLLNDGIKTKTGAKPTNNIKIRLLNTQPMPIQFLKGTKNSILTLSFDQGPEQFQLGNDGLTSTVKVAISGSSEIKLNNPKADKNLGDNGTITLTPSADFSWEKTGYLDLNITDLITDYEAGSGNIYISYEDIPGYWDGKLVVPVQKSPIKLGSSTKNNFVGVGVFEPLAPLSIHGADTLSNSDENMHISSDQIMFGGLNKESTLGSGTISVSMEKGKNWKSGEATKSYLTVLGAGKGADGEDRKVLIHAMEEMRVCGEINVQKHTNGMGTGNISATGAITGKTISDQHGLIVPVGTVQMFAGASYDIKGGKAITPPAGWLWCDGKNYLIADYENLHNAIMDPYNKSPINGVWSKEKYFAVPDLRGRFPVGTADKQALGIYGGERDVTLSGAQIPAHTHTATDSGHTHNFSYHEAVDLKVDQSTDGGDDLYAKPSWHSNAETETGIANITVAENTGGGGSHNNMPPFLTINFIIKY